MVLKHARMMPACFKTIGKVSRPCTRSQQRFPTLSTVGVLNYVLKVLHFKTFLATAACNIPYGFTQCHADSCVFPLTKTMQTPSGSREETLYLGCYVDDLGVLYEHDDEHSLYHDFVTKLSERWHVEDEGDLTDLLGIEFHRDGNSICLR